MALQADSNSAGDGLPHHSPEHRIGLLSNPASRRNRRAMPWIRNYLRDQSHVVHCEADNPYAIQSCLQQLAREQPDILAVNGGDGTVQAVLTSLFVDQPFAQLPLLAVLPGGNTNMTARDVGLRGGIKAALKRLCRWARSGRPAPEPVQRPVVRIQTNAAATPRCGMFFGAGAVVRGIQYCHDKVNSLGLHAELAPGFAALRMLIAVTRGEARFIAPTAVGIGINGEAPTLQQDCLLLLVSTLERLFLGIHPYWGTQQAPLHYTWVQSEPRHPLRAFPALLRGSPNRYGTPQAGYQSENIHTLALTMDGLYTLDGELYEASSAAGPLLIDHAGPARFVRL